MSFSICRHTDVREFDDLRCCLECGETRFNENRQQYTAPAEDQEYMYSDLRCLERGQTIRLATIEPGEPNDPLHCTMVLAGLKYSNYEAISYTWATETGDVTKSQPVYVDRDVLYVTKNCEAALRRLRQSQSHRRVWIDAICINQSNVRERNHQVGLMDQIYREAAHVHICINDPDKDHSGCMRWLNETEHTKSTEQVLAQFATLFNCRYFDRIWVVQEVALAKELILRVNNDYAALTVDLVSRLSKGYDPNKIRFPAPIKALVNRGSTKQLEQLLRISMSCSCSDPRDKIYGIISLLPPDLRILIPVDYSLNVEQVFAEAVLACIMTTRTLSILHFARLDDNEPDPAMRRSFTTKHLGQYLQWSNPTSKRARISYGREPSPFQSQGGALWLEEDDPSSPDPGDPPSLPLDSEEDEYAQLERQVDIPFIAEQILPCLRVRALLIDISRGLSGDEAEYLWQDSEEARLRGEYGRSDRCGIDAFFWNIGYDQGRGTRTRGFNTYYGVGFGFVESLPGDRLYRIEGAGSLILLRRVAGCKFRIVCACYWRQTSSPDNSTWVDIIMDAIANTEAQTQTIEIY